MRRISVFCGIVLVTFTASSVLAKGLKIGVVDMQRAVSETKEGKKAEKNLMGMKKKLENELNRKLKAFYGEEEKLRKAWSVLKESEKQKRAQDSRKKFEALQKRYLDAERELMAKKTKIMMKITKRLNAVIMRIAKRERYDYIFNNAGVLWAPRHVDLTNEVIRQYDK